MRLLELLVSGWVVLLGALLVNVIAKQLGLLTWYDLLSTKASATMFDWLFLLLMYPFLLGLFAWWGSWVSSKLLLFLLP